MGPEAEVMRRVRRGPIEGAVENLLELLVLDAVLAVATDLDLLDHAPLLVVGGHGRGERGEADQQQGDGGGHDSETVSTKTHLWLSPLWVRGPSLARSTLTTREALGSSNRGPNPAYGAPVLSPRGSSETSKAFSARSKSSSTWVARVR